MTQKLDVKNREVNDWRLHPMCENCTGSVAIYLSFCQHKDNEDKRHRIYYYTLVNARDINKGIIATTVCAMAGLI